MCTPFVLLIASHLHQVFLQVPFRHRPPVTLVTPGSCSLIGPRQRRTSDARSAQSASCSKFLYWIKAARLRGPRALAARGRRPLLSPPRSAAPPTHSARHPTPATHQTQSAPGTAAPQNSGRPQRRRQCSSTTRTARPTNSLYDRPPKSDKIRGAAPGFVAACGPVTPSPSGRPGRRGGVCGPKIKNTAEWPMPVGD